MKITRCATAVVEANYDYTYVRIHADNGIYGTGECFFAAGLTAALREMFPLLIKSWREDWGQGDFPFYWVQLTNFNPRQKDPGDGWWPELREAHDQAVTGFGGDAERIRHGVAVHHQRVITHDLER